MSVLHAPTYRWTVEEYEELGRAGIFDENDRVELLNGEIIVMSPIGYRHATAVNRLIKFFIQRARDRYIATPGNPFILDERSEPQPDLCLADSAIDTQGHHPDSAQIFLVIEVSDSTVAYDRQDKGPAYARNGVREYWMLNLDENVLEVFREPSADGYREARVLGRDDTIAPLAFPDLVLRAADFLP
jgi:Uma2 family endonuclease